MDILSSIFLKILIVNTVSKQYQNRHARRIILINKLSIDTVTHNSFVTIKDRGLKHASKSILKIVKVTEQYFKSIIINKHTLLMKNFNQKIRF